MLYRSPLLSRTIVALALLALPLACRDVASYQGDPTKEDGGRADVGAPLDAAHRDALAADQGPPGPPPIGDCGQWQLLPRVTLDDGVTERPALLPLPEGGWLAAWSRDNAVYTQRIEASGQTLDSAEMVAPAPQAQDVVLHPISAEPLVAWSERVDGSSSTDCRRRIGLKVLGPAPVFYYEEPAHSLAKPSLARVGDDVHLVVSREWYPGCGAQPHRKLMHALVTSNGVYQVQAGSYLLGGGGETSTFSPLIVTSPASSYGGAGGLAVLRLHSPDAEAFSASTWQLQLYRASFSGGLALEPMVVVGDVRARSTFSVLDDGLRLWIGSETLAGQVVVQLADGNNATPSTYATLGGRQPSLFHLPSPEGIYGLVSSDGPALQLRRLEDPAMPTIPSTKPDVVALGNAAVVHDPVSAAQAGVVGVAWLEDIGPMTRLVFRAARCQDSAWPLPSP